MALATLALQQGDLFSSYMVLLSEDEEGPLIGRAVVLRTVLEIMGAILHLKGSAKRSRCYLDYVQVIKQQAKDQMYSNKSESKDQVWSSSSIKGRVSLVDERMGRFYGTLCNFVHGNNTLYYYDSKQFTESFAWAK